MEEDDGVRFRLVFDDRHLLDKSQRSQGYHRCWFLVKPDITNIGDLASQIRECFGLRHRIVLYMDEFALPSFESTCIIKDKDIIMVKKKEAKKKDICKPRDDGKSQEKLQGNGSYDKETLTSYVENALHLASPGVFGLTKQKRKRSKKHLDSKHKEARRQMVFHSSDGEQNVASVVPLDYIRSEPREHGMQQAGETQESLLFEEGSNKEPARNKENSFPNVTNNDQCLKFDGAPVFDGILPLPKPEVMSSAVDISKPFKHVIHLEILLPLRRLPVKGDILTYHYVQSSSLVHPRFSSPQVGEVSSFDDKTLQIVLLPVLDYVFLFDENPHGTIGQPNASLYKEDGSLEIEYLSLVDVRLVKAHDAKEAKACQDDQAKNDKWVEASLKGNWNDPNATTAAQRNSWAQWIPNKSATAMSWSSKRHNAPFAGRGNGRTNWASNRLKNNWRPNMKITNWDPNKSNAVWNPNRSHTRFTSTDNISTLPRLYGASGLLPNPWEHHQNQDFLPSGSFFGSEKQ